MANSDKRSYPSMPVRQWWALRDRFKRSLPNKVDSSYLASVLAMSETSATNNILPSLRRTGLVDDNNAPTKLAIRWRDDTHYKKVCEEILKAVYPQTLLDIGSDANANRDEIARWFAVETGAGTNMVSKMTSFYILLCEADVTKGAETTSKSASTNRASTRTAQVSRKAPKASPPRKPDASTRTISEPEHRHHSGPSIHFDVQIHISPDTTPQQIDQIFAAMAKHLKFDDSHK